MRAWGFGRPKLTFWKMKFRAPAACSTFTQSTAHATVSTTVTPGACFPVRSPKYPTSFVPIHNVYIVSSGSSLSEPFAPVAAKY